MHLILHWLGADSASGTPYLLWSGVVGDLTIIAAVLGFPMVLFRKFECEMAWCIRIARHDWTDPERNIRHHLCRKHHPDHSGKMLRRHEFQRKLGLYLGKQPGKG